MGNASISARSAIVFFSGFLPSIKATTPVVTAADWEVPAAPSSYVTDLPLPVEQSLRKVSYEWASPVARFVGIVVHRWLQRIAEVGADKFDEQRLRTMQPVYRAMLAQLDMAEGDLEQGAELVCTALINTLNDECGRRILSVEHDSAACELPVTAVLQGAARSMIIDRTYIDTDGTRWIVDYKTSVHAGGDLEAFLSSETERYASQMRGYRDAMQLLEPGRPIRTALYFPLLQEFREIELQ